MREFNFDEVAEQLDFFENPAVGTFMQQHTLASGALWTGNEPTIDVYNDLELEDDAHDMQRALVNRFETMLATLNAGVEIVELDAVEYQDYLLVKRGETEEQFAERCKETIG